MVRVGVCWRKVDEVGVRGVVEAGRAGAGFWEGVGGGGGVTTACAREGGGCCWRRHCDGFGVDVWMYQGSQLQLTDVQIKAQALNRSRVS